MLHKNEIFVGKTFYIEIIMCHDDFRPQKLFFWLKIPKKQRILVIRSILAKNRRKTQNFDFKTAFYLGNQENPVLLGKTLKIIVFC